MTDADRELAREERAIYAIITAALAPVVVGILIEGQAIEGGGALSLLLVVLGVAGLLAGLRAFGRSRLPRARVHRGGRA